MRSPFLLSIATLGRRSCPTNRPATCTATAEKERERLHRQARFLEPMVHDRLPFRRRRRLLEVGCGVGAQTEILLRHFPEIHVTGVDINDAQLAEARRYLATVAWAQGPAGPRYDIVKMDATKLLFEPESFDCAFLCWILEHVPRAAARALARFAASFSPARPSCAARCSTRPSSSTPTAPTLSATGWNSTTISSASAAIPFIGAKLGNLLQSVGFRDVTTEVKHLPPRQPRSRRAGGVHHVLDRAPPLRRSGAPRGEQGVRRRRPWDDAGARARGE